jgi:coenzyme F420-reducing hydrogenase alpha subunit
VFACDEALRIIREYEPPERASVSVAPRAGVGSGCTEAPRGICYHRYRIDQRGTILDAKIVPPTSQNLMSIEQDVALLVPQLLDLPQEQMVHRCEQAIRNYDPCISCSTHFLRLRVERE